MALPLAALTVSCLLNSAFLSEWIANGQLSWLRRLTRQHCLTGAALADCISRAFPSKLSVRKTHSDLLAGLNGWRAADGHAFGKLLIGF
jgi:hypothetical protein